MLGGRSFLFSFALTFGGGIVLVVAGSGEIRTLAGSPLPSPKASQIGGSLDPTAWARKVANFIA